jgi:hypothetical protein
MPSRLAVLTLATTGAGLRNIGINTGYQRILGSARRRDPSFGLEIAIFTLSSLRKRAIMPKNRSAYSYLAMGAFLLFWCLPARAHIISAASCSQADVQNAINSSANGDRVVVPGGNCTWTQLDAGTNLPIVTISANNITLDGGGATTISGVVLFTAQAGLTRITGFTFTGSGTNGQAIYGYGCGGLTECGGSVTSTWRIDHNTFTSTVRAIFIEAIGNGPGLIDHNTFTGGAASEMIHNMGMLAEDANGWNDDLVPGGPNMLFVEDNTFTYAASGNPAYFWGSSAIQSYYGARTVFRHNSLTMVQIDQHGSPGAIGARWWEIYENDFYTVPNANQSNYMTLRGGSGVVFNNRQSGPNYGGGFIELVEEDSGYPALYQIGRGILQNLSPAYLWNNAASMSISSGSTNVQAGRDFFVSSTMPPSMARWESPSDNSATTYTYAPYTYPHPLQKAVGPAPPTGLTATVQ